MKPQRISTLSATMNNLAENKEFLLSSPVSSSRRVKLTPSMKDSEISRWESGTYKGQDYISLYGSSEFLCRLFFVKSEGKFMGRDVRGGVTTLTPVVPAQTPVEGVKNALMKRISDNQIKQREDDRINPNVVMSWDDGYKTISGIMDQFPKTSNKAIAIVGCNRPNYLKQVIEGLKANDLQGYDVFLFLDKPPRTSEFPMQVQQANLGLAANAVPFPFNFGCGQTLIEVRRQIFDRKGYDRAFIFEDDMVPCKNYLNYCEKLLEWGTQKYSNIGAVQGWNKCVMPAHDKEARSNEIHATFTNWWGYLMTKPAWDKIKPTLFTYRDSFLQRSYKVRPTVPILSFFKPMAERNFHLMDGGFLPDKTSLQHRRNLFDSPPSGQDGATWLAFDSANLVRLAPTVNRGLYIGELGIHSTADIYRKDRFDRMTLEDYPDDGGNPTFEVR